MKRELCTMSVEELIAWEQERRAEIRAAHAKGAISLDVHHELQHWVSEECIQWHAAYSSGLLGGSINGK